MRGSVQQETYLRAREAGASIEDACAASIIPPAETGIDLTEARLIEKAREAGEIPPPEPGAAPIGHNSKDSTMAEDSTADRLRLFIERAERLIEERKGIQDDLKDVFAEAKSTGFDVPTIKECIKLRAVEKAKRDEKAALLETYGAQLGLF
jgi:uncharacterized protein (UPF0335 family)